jgi:hypothetical protein
MTSNQTAIPSTVNTCERGERERAEREKGRPIMEVLIWPCINYFFHGVLIYTRRDDKEILARVT